MTRVTAKRLVMRGVLLAAALVATGAGESGADSPYAIRDPKVPKNLSPAARARLTRAAAIQKKQEARKLILEKVKADQAQAAGAAQKGAPNANRK
jgi:hypothetical protein